jgi:hypothetical protein
MSNLINLSKTAKISLEKKKIVGQKAQIVLAMDISGSMSQRYKNGTVQAVIERLLGIAMNMDDNQEIDVYAFGKGAYEITPANPSNAENYVNKVLLKKVSLEMTTLYAGVMEKIIKKFGNGQVNDRATKKGLFGKIFGAKEVAATTAASAKNMPTYVLFVTDGDNFDKPQTEKLIREASNQGIFWQFVGIGNERFDFLQKLDDLTGRFIDNADFFHLNDLSKITDENLYDRLLTEFPDWLKQAKEKGILE